MDDRTDNLSSEFSFVESLRQIQEMEKNVSNNLEGISAVCENINTEMLQTQTEFPLTKVQNPRRIFMASDLLIKLCSLLNRSVHLEFCNTVHDILQQEKYKVISKRIMRMDNVKVQWEKYFMQEAQRKILNFSDAVQKKVTEVTECGENNKNHQNLKTENKIQESEKSLYFTRYEIQDIEPYTAANITEIRADHTTEPLSLLMPNVNISRGTSSVGGAQSEISFKQIDLPDQADEEMNQILQFLTDEAKVPEINQSEIASGLLLEKEDLPNVPQQNEVEKTKEQCKSSAEDDDLESLLDIEPRESSKKRRVQVTFDNQIIIPDYAVRAMILNKNINIQRVQVYQGPPEIIQAMSVDYLMKTPGYRKCIPPERRSFRLNNLFHKHLIIEKGSHQFTKTPRENFRNEVKQIQKDSNALERRVLNKSQFQQSIEEHMERSQMRSQSEKKDALTSVLVDRDRSNGMHTDIVHEKSVIEKPLPTIMQLLERTNESQLHTEQSLLPMVQEQVQKKEVEKESSRAETSWFISTKENPPGEKWREYDFVKMKLQQYWTLTEMEGVSKSINLLELLKIEGDLTKASFFTLLRIVDKLWLQRKVSVETKNELIHIKPFKIQYVSEKLHLSVQSRPKF